MRHTTLETALVKKCLDAEMVCMAWTWSEGSNLGRTDRSAWEQLPSKVLTKKQFHSVEVSVWSVNLIKLIFAVFDLHQLTAGHDCTVTMKNSCPAHHDWRMPVLMSVAIIYSACLSAPLVHLFLSWTTLVRNNTSVMVLVKIEGMGNGTTLLRRVHQIFCLTAMCK